MEKESKFVSNVRPKSSKDGKPRKGVKTEKNPPAEGNAVTPGKKGGKKGA